MPQSQDPSAVPDAFELKPPFTDFLKHWRSLARDGGIPALSDFLDHAEPRFQPWVVILDVDERTYNPIRFLGTGLIGFFGVELTGQNLLDTIAPELRPIYEDWHAEISQRPCGAWQDSTCSTTTGREVGVDSLGVPLRRRGDQKCVAWFIQLGSQMQYGEAGVKVRQVTGAKWIDLGRGVPPSGQADAAVR